MKAISKRKLESYKRAESIARECRYLLANNYTSKTIDFSAFSDMVHYWMNSTGNIKYKRPKPAPKLKL